MCDIFIRLDIPIKRAQVTAKIQAASLYLRTDPDTQSGSVLETVEVQLQVQYPRRVGSNFDKSRTEKGFLRLLRCCEEERRRYHTKEGRLKLTSNDSENGTGRTAARGSFPKSSFCEKENRIRFIYVCVSTTKIYPPLRRRAGVFERVPNQRRPKEPVGTKNKNKDQQLCKW